MKQTFISKETGENIKKNFGRGEAIPAEFREEKPAKAKKAGKISWILLVIVVLFTAALNIISINSTAFSDWYTANVFPLWQKTYGRLTSMCRYSIGEMLIALGLILIPVSVIILIICLIRKKGRRLKSLVNFVKFWLWTAAIIALVMTLNCFILYHCSTFAQLNGITVTEHTHGELENLGRLIVQKTNQLGDEVNRDSQGKFVLTSDVDITAKNAVKNLSDEYKNLEGFYAFPKPVKSSFFMSQLNIMGVYFPFSMEANYNNDMPALRLPDTVCHELAHTKGYIQEDEANFIAFAACDKSGNTDYAYSGYIGALMQVRSKIFAYASDEQKAEFDNSISDKVWVDLTDYWNYWKSVEEAKDTIIDSKTAGEISDKAMDKSLKLNGVKDGKESYGRVVDLLLEYFAKEIKE